uniref:ferrochelatase n=1 Tax=Staphylococcus epidermidis TaxID=1282 RepID=UPI0016425397
HPKFIKYSTQKINQTLQQIPNQQHHQTLLLLSAHTLPKPLIQTNNHPYPHQFHQTPQILKHQSNIIHLPQPSQSQGNTRTPWLRP